MPVDSPWQIRKRSSTLSAFLTLPIIYKEGNLILPWKVEVPLYTPDNYSMLNEFSRVAWLTEDEGLIDGYIRYRLTGAHSKFHQVFWIEEQGKKVFFGGDVAPQLQQMKSRFVAKYDFDGKLCMELRKQWWEQGEHEKWTFLFYHDIKVAGV